MRLLHVIPSVNPAAGGPAEAVRTFMRHPLGSAQAVLTLDHSTDPWINNFPEPVYCAGPGRGKYGFTPSVNSWLRMNVRNYDAVLVHGCWQYHGPAAAFAAHAAHVPWFVFTHGMLDPWFRRNAPLKHLKKLLYWPIERAVLQRASSVFFTCQEEEAAAHRSFSFTCRSRIVPLGVEQPTSRPEEARAAFFDRFSHLRGKRLILFLGRLHPKKGIDLLIEAFRGIVHPQAHLVIAGPPADPEYESHLRSIAERDCGAERVTFTGMLAGRLKSGALQAADVFILPSHQENFGISVIEALASGLPVLLSDQVNIWHEILEDGAGLVEPDTQAGVRKLLGDWFAKSMEETETMRAAARRCWHSRFRAEAASARLLSTISECIRITDEPARVQFSSMHA